MTGALLSGVGMYNHSYSPVHQSVSGNLGYLSYPFKDIICIVCSIWGILMGPNPDCVILNLKLDNCRI